MQSVVHNLIIHPNILMVQSILVIVRRVNVVFLRRYITVDETWIHFHALESTEKNPPKGLKVNRAADRIAIVVDYHPKSMMNVMPALLDR